MADGAMRPILHLFGRIGKRQAVSVQALGTELPVERFDEGVVRRLARPRELEFAALLVGQELEVVGDELGDLVSTDRLRIADRRANPLQYPDHVLGPVAEPGHIA